MSLFSLIIEYPDYLSSLTCRIIGKVPYAYTIWKILAFVWVFLLGFIAIDTSLHKKEKNSLLYITAVLIGIIAFRLPNLVLPMLNFDEADWGVCAATLWKKPIFWGDVDATTSGPLNIYPILLIKVLGGHINYFNLRLFTIIFCSIPTFILSYFTIKNLSNNSFAILFTLPLAVIFALLNETDLVSFDSTYIPMVVVALCFALLLSIKSSTRKNLYIALLLSFILGSIPYVKLQAVPIGLGLGVWLVYKAIFEWKFSLLHLTLLFLFALLPSLLVISLVFYFNIENDFWQSYILNNLLYASLGIEGEEKNWWFKIRVPLYLISVSPSISYFFYSMFSVSVLALSFCLIHIKKLSQPQKIDLLGVVLVFLMAYYAVSQPGNICHYYLILLITPLFFMASVSSLFAYEILRTKNKPTSAYLVIFLFLTVGIQAIVSINKGSIGIKEIEKGYRGAGIPPVAELIKKFTSPDDYIAVLGYSPDLYIATNTILGIREAQTTRMHFAFKGLQKNYYENRIAQDIAENKPTVVVDASMNSNMSYNYNDSTTRYENFSLVKEVIEKNYRYHGMVDSIRVFVRK